MRLLLLLLLCLFGTSIDGFILRGIDKIRRDFLALTRKVTARHILLPKNDDVALALKQKIRQEAGLFLVDPFEEAAKKYSRDETTKYRGGLLGELVPQGYCKSPELDQACFQVPLGEVFGPIESSFGYHLLLVSERTNCPKLDGERTKYIKTPDGKGVLVRSEQRFDTPKMVGDQALFFLFVFFAGGILAEVAAIVGNAL